MKFARVIDVYDRKWICTRDKVRESDRQTYVTHSDR